MREILFKAKVKNWRELPKEKWWVEGYFFPGRTVENGIGNMYAFIRDLQGENHWVDPETVCQYTELIDKNRKKIFEWDIVRCVNRGAAFWRGIVIWNDKEARFDIKVGNCSFPLCLDDTYGQCIFGTDYEVIGSIFDESE